MNRLNHARTLAVSLGVLAFGAMAVSPAMAFDEVNWTWHSYVDNYVDVDSYINLNINISGEVQVEKLQIFLGDVHAESTVDHITNTPFYPVVAEQKREHDKGYGDDNHNHGPAPTTYALFEKHEHGRDPGFDKIEVAPLDATTQLPIVLSSATAIGNNQSITSDVPVFLHDGQFVAEPGNNYDVAWSNPSEYSGYSLVGHAGNSNTELAALFTLGAVFHVLKEADIKAKSEVYDIKNASVDSSATAVANNMNVTVASDNASNHVVIGDITQFALANVRADSDVHDVSATGYSNMRQLTTATLQTSGSTTDIPVSVPTPFVSSVATAIGNNASITVGPVQHIVGH